MWEIMQKVRYAYSLNNVMLNLYEYESSCYLEFKDRQDAVGPIDGSMKPLQMMKEGEPGIILVCALRKLNEVLMEISEFLNSPTEEQIASSFVKWQECYVKELVYDSEQKDIDMDGVSRFLFTNTERFGVSHRDNRPSFSKELLRLFNFVDTWQMMQTDLQPKKKQTEKTALVVDELEVKVNALVVKLKDLTTDSWKPHLPKLWKNIFTTFRNEISKAGTREKFKEYSKKTVYCIIGHLKSKGVYQQISNVQLTVLLEGENSGMRKYLNNGLIELEDTLKNRIEKYVDQEMQKLVAKT